MANRSIIWLFPIFFQFADVLHCETFCDMVERAYRAISKINLEKTSEKTQIFNSIVRKEDHRKCAFLLLHERVHCLYGIRANQLRSRSPLERDQRQR